MITEIVDRGLKAIPCCDLLKERLIFLLLLFGFINHSLNIILRESSSIIGNGNFLRSTLCLINSTNIKDGILINLEGNLDLGYTSGGGWNTF